MAVDWAHIRSCLPIEKSQKAERKKMFQDFDNGNGILSLAEVDKSIRDVLKCDAMFDAKPAIMRAFQLAKSYKTSKRGEVGDDYIELGEFGYFLQMLRYYFEIYIVFKQLDTDGDKRITLLEFKEGVEKLNAETNLNIEDVEATFTAIDKNGGGFILFDEFVIWSAENKLDLNDDDD